jgi:hypothetical protein
MGFINWNQMLWLRCTRGIEKIYDFRW